MLLITANIINNLFKLTDCVQMINIDLDRVNQTFIVTN